MVLHHEAVHPSTVLSKAHSRADSRCAEYSYSIQIQFHRVLGFYTHGGVPVSVFYQWLRFILQLGRHEGRFFSSEYLCAFL